MRITTGVLTVKQKPCANGKLAKWPMQACTSLVVLLQRIKANCM